MATTNIIPFANTTSNLYSDAAYDAFAPTGQPLGYQPPSGLHNKVFLQSSIMVAAIAEFIASNQSNNIIDTDTTTNIASYFLLALKTALGKTPPQFDNSIALATTEFIQRALGNSQQTYPIYDDTVLTPADVGAYIVIGAGNTPPITITLPLSSECITGTVVRMASYAPDVTVVTQGGDLINDGIAVTSYPITLGSYITFVWRADGEWLIADGNTNITKQPGWKFLQGPSGYQRFPSGLFLQWTSVTFAPLNPVGSVNDVTGVWPQTFNSIFMTQVTQAPTAIINEIAEFAYGSLFYSTVTPSARFIRTSGGNIGNLETCQAVFVGWGT